MARGEHTPGLVGRQLGPYRVVAPIAAGGMGEVFRARDEKLQRDVALKLLPPAFVADRERLARFEREARLLAQLNHPHIAAIYGFVEEEGVHALVLELVEGPTLAERIVRGPLPLPAALAIAQEIASALEAAHERGIIHRDLKPDNIKLTPVGSVKVLDFGIAKAAGEAQANHTHVETVAADTATGAVVGTVGYMSPEQLRGQPVDRRTDMWAFGCVLFEMLTGRAAFAASTSSDSVAAVLDRDPEWSRLPSSTPASVRRFLQRCLEKDPKQRLRDAGDARLALADAQIATDSARGAVSAQSRRPAAAVLAIAVATLAGAVALLWNVVMRDTPTVSPEVTRSTLPLPVTQELDVGPGAYPLAISRDGRRIVYAGSVRGGAVQLFVRDLASFETKALAGTEGARHPFFSPDGQAVAFFAERKLKRVDLAGGAPVPLCDAPPPAGHGTWGSDGTIIFDAGGLRRVSSNGGTPEPVRTGNAESDDPRLREPHFLPGGQALLVTTTIDNVPTVAAVNLQSGTLHAIARGTQPAYVAPGYVVYHAENVREGELHAVAFDAEQLAPRGQSFSVQDGVFRARAGGAVYYALAEAGTFVFAPGGLAHSLVRVDRQGRRTPITADRRGFRFPRISPNGRDVAITIDPRPSRIWVYALPLSSGGRLLAADGHNISGTWHPDGRHYTYFSKGDIYSRVSDASGAEERLFVREGNQYPHSWTSDGSRLLFVDDDASTYEDIWTFATGGVVAPLIVTPARENNPRPSPDGRWLAHMSDESGRPEIHVRPFPDVQMGKWVVSAGGGHSPVWSEGGRELFYMNGNTVMSVAIEAQRAGFVARPPEPLFSGPFDTTQDSNFDVSKDGTFFVMVEADPDQRPTRLQVILNWSEELRQRGAASATPR